MLHIARRFFATSRAKKNAKFVLVRLHQNVEHVGKAGDIVRVARGHARNQLVRSGLASYAALRDPRRPMSLSGVHVPAGLTLATPETSELSESQRHVFPTDVSEGKVLPQRQDEE